MDYQFACVLQFLALCAAFAKTIGRDLVLTPKQLLQINGKSIYYAEERADELQKRALIPWERTLKHVTYVTIFTDISTEAAAGNLSDQQEYNNFLKSPYIRQNDSNNVRFGDIVTLASGRLETLSKSNNSYRFIEGTCDYQCQERDVLALWQVQKIRHRDVYRTYRYDMKYSIRPLHVQSYIRTRGGGNDELSFQRNSLRTYIQKDDDYPQNFGHLSYAGEQSFAERRLSDVGERSFRQVSAHSISDYMRQVTPIPELTFLRDSFRPPSTGMHHVAMPSPDRLNIGEYIKSFGGAKQTSKQIEVFPNIDNRMGYHTPTTFRPSYNLNIIKPPIYQQGIHKVGEIKFPKSEPQTYNSILSAPLVTHHFHHHFYMPPSGDNNLSSAEKQQQTQHQQQLQTQHQQQLHTQHQQQLHTQHQLQLQTEHQQQLQKHHQQQLHQEMLQQRFQSQVATPYKPVVQDQESAVVTYPLSTPYYKNFNSLRAALPPSPQKVSIPFTTVQEPEEEDAEKEEVVEEPPQLLKQHLVRVTPVPPLRKPHIYQMFPITIGPKIPLFIYPAPVEESEESEKGGATQRSGHKPFLQSERLDPDKIRYSEPDPLYEHTAESIAPELEPTLNHKVHNMRSASTTTLTESYENNSEPPDSITAQLPPPAKGQDLRVPYVDDVVSTPKSKQTGSETKGDQEQNSSLKNVQISTEKISSSTVKTEATPANDRNTIKTEATPVNDRNTIKTEATPVNDRNTIKTEATPVNDRKTIKTEATPVNDRNTIKTEATPANDLITIKTETTPTMDLITLQDVATTAIDPNLVKTETTYKTDLPSNVTTTATTQEVVTITTEKEPMQVTLNTTNTMITHRSDNNIFPSTSTAQPSTRTAAVRKRLKLTRTTTEQPVLKWMPRRPGSYSGRAKKELQAEDKTEIEKIISAGEITPNNTNSQMDGDMKVKYSKILSEMFEVLTQKSVSKSVSIKIGNNGEEIPIIEDDVENMVKF